MELPSEMKDHAWKVVTSRTVKMSLRVQSLVIYAYMRFCDIVDYWFPVKMTLREADEVLRKWVKAANTRMKNYHKDDPKGETIDAPCK